MMHTPDGSTRRYFALRCDPNGVVRERRAAGLASEALQPGASLLAAVAEGSRTKALRLLDELAQHGIVFDWELNWIVADRPVRFYVNGSRLGDDVWLVGAPTRIGATQHLAAVVAEVDGHTARLVQAAVQDRLRLLGRRDEPEEAILDEFTELQNELATMQRDVIKQNVELERLNRDKNYFIGMAAHELRNPLCSIRFYSNYLATQDDLPDEKRARFLNVIYETSGFMTRLIEDLLSVSRIESGQLDLTLEQTDLTELVAHNVELNQLLAEEKQIQLRGESAPSAPVMASVDRHKIDQVLTNLITNAIKFSPPGSTVQVRVEQEGDQVQIAVADEGPGIPEDERQELFQPFRTTSVKASAGERSTGLGLYISHRIVEGHQGRLWVESTVGEGSTFYFTLPTTTLAVNGTAAT